MEPVLYTKYKKEVAPALKEELGIANIMDVPAVEKVTLNVGFGRHSKDKSFIENVENTLRQITGQKPVRTKARLSISNFKLREGMEIGACVTLRGATMYEFLNRLVNLTLPRVRDFRGISAKSFDRKGNYSLGIKENISFPEISADSADKIHSLQVIVTTSAEDQKGGALLLKKLGFPFKDMDKIK
ncbi:MAG: 50S ribosomal protein L5 [Candidatus Magasanikbacteria bacterium]|jgi:large subunit ribosomal protein L5|nr:50S ribosomal protein L5 [Candidatus Magasanikbacteria bacterium]